MLNYMLIAKEHLIKSSVSFMLVRYANRVKNGIAVRSSYLTFLLHRRRVNTPVKDRAINHKFQLCRKLLGQSSYRFLSRSDMFPSASLHITNVRGV